MAIFYLNVQAVSRSSGKNACRAAAYNARTKVVDQKSQKSYNYSDRTDLANSLIITPTINGSTFEVNRSELWNSVEAGEKRPDAQLARSIVLALPTEINHQAKWQLTQEFVRDNFTKEGMIADVNIHDIDSHNPHVHILLTMRNINEITPSGEIVFGLKNRDWNSKALLEEQKENWADSVNRYLELAQVPDRISHLTPTDRVPQIHIGTTAWEMEKQGIQTALGDIHREIAATNENIQLLRDAATVAQQSLEVELRLEVERRERERLQREESQRTAEQEQRKQQSPFSKFIERVDRFDRFFDKDPNPIPKAEIPISEPKVEAEPEESETSADRFIRQRQEQRAADELKTAELEKYVKEVLANNPQLKNTTPSVDPTTLEREDREREARLEVRRLANRAANEKVRLARAEREEAARQRELETAQQPINSPAAITEIEPPVESLPQTHTPTRLELVNWYQAGTKEDQQKIMTLAQQLKNDYMSQPSMHGQPEPKTLPNEFQSTTVSISLVDKDQFDRRLATWQQKRETPLGKFIERAKEMAAQDPTGKQTFGTIKTTSTLDQIAMEDPINRAGIKILNKQLINNYVNKVTDAENLNKLIARLEQVRDNPERYQNIEREREIERQNANSRTNSRDRGGFSR